MEFQNKLKQIPHDSLLKPYRNVFSGNFDTHCLQMASATYLGGSERPKSITPLPAQTENLEHTNFCNDLFDWPSANHITRLVGHHPIRLHEGMWSALCVGVQ